MNNFLLPIDTEVRNFIKAWSTHYYAVSNGLNDFFRLLEIEIPTTYNHFDVGTSTFEFTSGYEKMAISLYSYESLDMGPILTIFRGEKEEEYYAAYDDNGNPYLQPIHLSSRNYCTGHKLDIYPGPSLLNINLTLNNTNVLNISISNPDFNTPRIYSNVNEVEPLLIFGKFLLEEIDEDNISDVHNIYKHLLKILKISKSEVSNSIIQLSNTINNCLESELLFKEGKVERYATRENDGVYCVSRTGDWKYHNNSITIEYSAKTNLSVFSISGNCESMDINPKSIFIDIKKTIDNMMSCFNK